MPNARSADVVIIGGGAMGTATAFRMAKAGLSVILVEMRNIGSGASGRCDGMVCICYGRSFNIDRAPERIQFTRYNIEKLKEWQNELDIDYQYRQNGLLDIWTNDDELREGHELYEYETALGTDAIEILDKHETLSLMPILNPDIVKGARFRKEDGNIAPYKMCNAFAWGAKKYGAQVLTHTRVEKILIENDKVQGVMTDKGPIYAKWVLNATNAWSSQLSKECAAVVPNRAAACATEAVGPLPPFPFESILGNHFIAGGTQMKNGNLVINGPAQPREARRGYFNETMYLDETRRQGRYLSQMFPKLRDIRIIRTWIGTMAYCPDGFPMIGKSAMTEGLLIAAGFAAGMSQECTVADIMTDLVTKGEVQCVDVDMSAYDPGRFGGGSPIVWPEPHDLSICGDVAYAYSLGKYKTPDDYVRTYDVTSRQ